MAFDNSFNYHSGLWLLLSRIIVQATKERLNDYQETVEILPSIMQDLVLSYRVFVF